MNKKDYSIHVLVNILRSNAERLMTETGKPCSFDPVKAYEYLCDVGNALSALTETFDELDDKIYPRAKKVVDETHSSVR